MCQAQNGKTSEKYIREQSNGFTRRKIRLYIYSHGVRCTHTKNKIGKKRVENLILHLRALPQYNLTDCGASCARLQLKLKLNSHKITWNVQKMRLQKQKKIQVEKMRKFFEIENNVWVAVRHERLSQNELIDVILTERSVDWKPEKRLRHFVFVINYFTVDSAGATIDCVSHLLSKRCKAGISVSLLGIQRIE